MWNRIEDGRTMIEIVMMMVNSFYCSIKLVSSTNSMQLLSHQDQGYDDAEALWDPAQPQVLYLRS